jgi:signal transduction histidine kinase
MSKIKTAKKSADATRFIMNWEVVFDSLDDPILITGLDGSLIHCNRTACESLQLKERQLSSLPVTEIFPKAFNSQTHEPVNGRYCIADSVYNLSATPYRPDEKVEGWVILLKNVTEEKKYENDLRKTQHLAGIGALAAGMAQEINSQLQIITGVGDGLLKQARQGKLDRERFQKKLEQLSENAWKAAKILRSLLVYTQATPGQLIPADLNQLVRDSIYFIQTQITETEQVSFSTFLAANLPVLVCDPAQITQAILQLANNAREAVAGKEGTIIVSTRYIENEDVLVLRVEDNGCGIPEKMQERIFEPLFSTKPVDEASGLGLAQVADIMQAHSGKIEMNSTPGKGSAFSLVFPRRHNAQPGKD